MIPTEDARLFELMTNKLYAAVISDCLDEQGLRNQAMTADLRPLWDEAIVCGRAMTVLAVDVYDKPKDPYKLEIESVDSLKAGDVLVAQTNGSQRTGYWGELLSTAAKMRGATGAVVEGFVRDVRAIRRLGFPVFSTGIKPVDSMGRSLVIDYACPIECGGVKVKPGDIVFGDIDGVVVIPQEVEQAVVARALEKVTSEKRSLEALKGGAYLRDVYDRFGVL